MGSSDAGKFADVHIGMPVAIPAINSKSFVRNRINKLLIAGKYDTANLIKSLMGNLY